MPRLRHRASLRAFYTRYADRANSTRPMMVATRPKFMQQDRNQTARAHAHCNWGKSLSHTGSRAVVAYWYPDGWEQAGLALAEARPETPPE